MILGAEITKQTFDRDSKKITSAQGKAKPCMSEAPNVQINIEEIFIPVTPSPPQLNKEKKRKKKKRKKR